MASAERGTRKDKFHRGPDKRPVNPEPGFEHEHEASPCTLPPLNTEHRTLNTEPGFEDEHEHEHEGGARSGAWGLRL
jgi:hypothetical protein